MTAKDLSKVLQEPTGEQSSHSAGRNHNLINKRKSDNESMLLVDLPLIITVVHVFHLGEGSNSQ